MACSMNWSRCTTTYFHIYLSSPLIFKKPSVNLFTEFNIKAKQFNAGSLIRLSDPTSIGRFHHRIVESNHWRMMASVSEASQVAETRFASHTIVMRRLVKVQTALSQMVISNQWGIWKASNSERAQKVKALVLDDSWWARVQFVLDFTDPIMTMLRFADTDTPCLGDVYDGMDTMIEKVKVAIQNHENDPTECEALCNKVEAIIHHRWEKMTTPLHLLAYALSPRYYSQQVLGMPGRVAPYADEEVANGCYKAFTRLFPDDQMHDSVREEFGLFASGSKMSPYAIKDQYKTGAITWWYMYGQPFKYLQPLAIKILSQSLASDNMDEQTNFWQQVEGHQKLAAKLPAVERVRTLIDCSSSGILSTFSQKYDGYPSGSIVDFASSEDGCPILAVSSLAVHTKDLLANPKCSLLVTKDPADRTDLIVTIHGDASFVPEEKQESSRACYLRKHPGAFWVDFGDFQFVRIEPKCVRYVSGIATAMLESGDFTEEEYKSALVDPISQFSVPVASHMNRDHAEDTKLIVQHSTAIQVDYAHIIDLDRLGFNVKVGYHGKAVKLRIPFPRPAEDRRDVKTLIVQMLEAAKESSTK